MLARGAARAEGARGGTRGYTRHPQLERFRGAAEPLDAIGHFLGALRDEATARGYRFDGSRILRADAANPVIPVSDGQLAFELAHLRAKVAARDAGWLPRLPQVAIAAPSFVVRGRRDRELGTSVATTLGSWPNCTSATGR